MRYALLTLLTLTSLSGCRQLRAVSYPYFDGLFVGQYVAREDATPAELRLEVEASVIEGKRYTITGNATLGTANFTARGHELALGNLTYLTPQAPPPPMGNAVIEFLDDAGTTAYTLCASLIYRDYDDSFRVNGMTLLEGPPIREGEAVYCSPYADFATAELEKQPD